MGADYFCRFCEAQMPYSKGEEKCALCQKISVPLCEEDISIEVGEVKRKLDSSEPFVLLDVRMPHEHEFARIGRSFLIPLPELPQRLSEVPKDKEVAIHCRSGARSRKATLFLLAHGYTNVRNMLGGIMEWSQKIDSSIPRY